MARGETLILGVGNELLHDEGAGIFALRLLQHRSRNIPGLCFLDGGTLSFTLASWIEEAQNLIVFDAAMLDLPTGSVRCLVNQEMDDFLGVSKRSAHEVGLIDLLNIARLTETLPQRRALIGIQPETFGWGLQPGEAVRNALPVAVAHAIELICLWHPDVSADDFSPDTGSYDRHCLAETDMRIIGAQDAIEQPG